MISRIFGDYEYCCFCGSSRLAKDVEECKMTCLACGKIFYLNSKPAVAAVIQRQAEILLVRTVDTGADEWDLPGGFLRYGEPPRAGLERELREELGVTVRVGRLLDAVVDTYATGQYCLNLFYDVQLVTRAISLGGEICEYAWFDLAHLPACAYQSTVAVLAMRS